MYYEKEKPTALTGKALDQYLANGWYRMGQAIFTCWFLCIGEGIYSTLWLRLELEGFRFSKSQRKLMRKNKALFVIEITEGILTEEMETLFEKYKADFKGTLYPSLRHYLLDGGDQNIYNTKAINIYHNDQLIAFSFFDLGEKSLASIQGVYDPAYKQYSLGYYTMLLEMEYGMAHGFKYYYPGYVVPGYAHFDYKTRIGAVDFFHTKTMTWQPYENIDQQSVPIQLLKEKIRAIQQAFARAGILTKPFFYPYYDASVFFDVENQLLHHPFFVIWYNPKSPFFFLATYNIRTFQYESCLCLMSLVFSVESPRQQSFYFDDYFIYMNDVLDMAVPFPPVDSIEALIEIFQEKVNSQADH